MQQKLTWQGKYVQNSSNSASVRLDSINNPPRNLSRSQPAKSNY